MNTLKSWILSILGIVVLGVVIDLILPNGRMHKYLRSVFAAVTMLVLLLPLPNLLREGLGEGNTLFEGDMPQIETPEYAVAAKRNALISGLRAALKEKGITLGDVSVEGDFTSAVPQLTKVRINMRQVVISGQTEHIHKNELIRNEVSAALAVDKDVIEIYE